MSYYNGFGAPAGAAVIKDGDGPENWNPYPAPPTPPAEDGSVSTTGSGILNLASSVVSGLVNIFGHPVQPAVAPRPVAQAGVPIWVWVLIPVGIVGLLAVMRPRRASVAGYKRRKSRKSRR